MRDNRFYTYHFLDSNWLPYYVGMGSGRRDTARHRVPVPADSAHIFKQYWASKREAKEMERWWIKFWGRKDLGLGYLLNRTDGGDKTDHMNTPAARANKSKALKGRKITWGAKISLAAKNSPAHLAHCRKLADEQRGKPNEWTPEHRANHKAAASVATTRMNATHKRDPFWIARARAMAEAQRGKPAHPNKSQAAIRTNHTRWHVQRNIKSPTCSLCNE